MGPAKERGKRLLEEHVEEIGLHELLLDLDVFHQTQIEASEPTYIPPILNIQPLDRRLHKLVAQKASIPQQSHLSYATNQIADRTSKEATTRAPVIELASPSSGAGKTHVVYQAVAAAALSPRKSSRHGGDVQDSANIGGKGGAAIVLDTDRTFDIVRLAQIMKHFWASSTSANPENRESHSARADSPHPQAHDDPEQVEAITLTALTHVHILRPQSFASLISTIASLPDYLFDFSQHHSSSRAVELIAIDSVTAFYWQEKMAEEKARYGDDSQSSREDETSPNQQEDLREKVSRVGYAELVDALKDVQKVLGCPILATSWAVRPQVVTDDPYARRGGEAENDRAVLPQVWNSFCAVRLGVRGEKVKKFPETLSLEQALRDREARQSVVERGKFSVWAEGVRSGNVGAGTSVEFRILEDGVEFDDE